jgi:hypothetical protein
VWKPARRGYPLTMVFALLCGLSVVAVLVWRRAVERESATYQPGTFFSLLFLGGLLAPAIPALIIQGGTAREYVVPLVLTMSILLGIAACFRPGEEEWAEDEERGDPH